MMVDSTTVMVMFTHAPQLWPFGDVKGRTNDLLCPSGVDEDNPDQATAVWLTIDWDSPSERLRSSKDVSTIESTIN